jgi:diguanylate cyclase
MPQPRDLQAAQTLADRANELLKDHAVAPIPRNYEIFYTHAAGTVPALCAALDAALAAGGGLTAAEAEALHKAHLCDDGIGRRLEEVGRGLGAIIREIKKVLLAAGGSADAVQGCLAALGGPADPAAEREQFRALFELVDRASRQLKTATETLQENLSRSQDQVIDLGRCLTLVQTELSVDPLTSITNRAGFDRQLERAVHAACDAGEPLTVLMLDVDRFKSFNDTYGHQTGDAVLKYVARLIQACVGSEDIAARYGGEEFAVILPKTRLQQGVVVAEKIRLAVGARAIQRRSTGKPIGKVTVSIGAASLEMADTPETLLERADHCLLHAKRSGRDMVKFAAPAPRAKTNAA